MWSPAGATCQSGHPVISHITFCVVDDRKSCSIHIRVGLEGTMKSFSAQLFLSALLSIVATAHMAGSECEGRSATRSRSVTLLSSLEARCPSDESAVDFATQWFSMVEIFCANDCEALPTSSMITSARCSGCRACTRIHPFRC
jgi:hypothetical protein